MNHRVLFRVDGSSEIGLGHLTRCLALSDIISNLFEISFVIRKEYSGLLSPLINKRYNIIELESPFRFSSGEARSFSLLINQSDIVVLDGYFFDTEYQQILKEKKCRLVCIDDMHSIKFVSDAVINHSNSADENDYHISDNTKLYLGFDYLLLRREFLMEIEKPRILPENKTIFICFGGADPNNLTLKSARAVFNTGYFDEIKIVIGKAYLFQKELNEYIKGKNIKILSGLSASAMCEEMHSSRMALVPSSTVALEVFCIGLNTVLGYYVDNQKEFLNYAHEKRLGYSVGSFLDISEKELSDAIMNNVDNNSYKVQKEMISGNPEKNLIKIFTDLI
ncbi:MAG: UDP-2,4-diacetamido-2,4,6-trideoxy-beta-L-altropyranose hydrolase [Cytophagaceae bacterium]